MERRIRLRIAVDEIQANDGCHVRDSGILAQNCLCTLDDLGRPHHGGTARQLNDHKQRPLIVFRQEAGRRDLSKRQDARARDRNQHKTDQPKSAPVARPRRHMRHAPGRWNA